MRGIRPFREAVYLRGSAPRIRDMNRCALDLLEIREKQQHVKEPQAKLAKLKRAYSEQAAREDSVEVAQVTHRPRLRMPFRAVLRRDFHSDGFAAAA